MCHSMLCMIIFFVGHCVSQKLRTQTPKNLELPKTQTLGFAENSDPQFNVFKYYNLLYTASSLFLSFILVIFWGSRALATDSHWPARMLMCKGHTDEAREARRWRNHTDTLLSFFPFCCSTEKSRRFYNAQLFPEGWGVIVNLNLSVISSLIMTRLFQWYKLYRDISKVSRNPPYCHRSPPPPPIPAPSFLSPGVARIVSQSRALWYIVS